MRYFEMKNSDNRSIYFLFFVTNNELGHLKMKEAMWRVDKEGDFQYSDATNPDQIVFFKMESFGDKVFNLIKKKYGAWKDDVIIIRKFIENETAFLSKHLNQALKFAEDNSLIEVDQLKKDGKKRRKGTFPDGTIIRIK